MSQYVQHISGQGKKWKVDSGGQPAETWWVERAPGAHCILPKSEYRLCSPPEKWVDITDQISVGPDYLLTRDSKEGGYEVVIKLSSHYRAVKKRFFEPNPNSITGSSGCQYWAFIIEKNES